MDPTGLKFAKMPRKKKRNHLRRNKTRERNRMMRELDNAARMEVFERDRMDCIAKGVAGIKCADVLQWAHVLSRRHLCLRWEADNAMSLCAGHHLFWHGEPAVAVEWFINKYPERWQRIKNVLLVNPKVSVEELWNRRCANGAL